MVKKTQDEVKEAFSPEATPTFAPDKTPEVTPEATPDEIIPSNTAIPHQSAPDLWKTLPENFSFSSGVGAWGTIITIADDGSFTGEYHDSDAEFGQGYEGLVYFCQFEGKFSAPQKLTDYIYTTSLESLTALTPTGTEKIEDQLKYVYVDPYGFENAKEFYIYMPNTPIKDVADGFMTWSHLYPYEHDYLPDDFYGIYNIKDEEGFVGYADKPTPAPTPVPTPASTASTDDLVLMETLLIGASADTKEADVAKWTDEEFIDVMYGKLNNSVGDPLFDSLGLTYSFDDGTLKFDLKQIQALAKNMFNREMPLTVNAMYAYVSGDSFCIMPADGFMTKLEVQSAETKDQYTIVKGVIAEYGGTNAIAGLFEATLQKNDQYPLGYTIVSLKPIASTPKTNLTVTASSTLKDDKFSYAPENVLDDDLATSWVEGVKGLGQGQWIKLSTTDNSKMNLSSISFALGYQDPKDFELLYENSAPSKVRVECENGFSKDVEFYSYDDVVIFDSVQKTSWVKITILEAYESTKFDDTCISEIRIYELNS